MATTTPQPSTTLQGPTPTLAGPGPDARAPQPRRTNPLPYGLMLPAVLALALALGYPLVRQVLLSFQDYGLAQQFGQPAQWVGLDNYIDLVTDSYLWVVVARSVAFCLVNAGLTMVLGTAIALLLGKLSTPVRIVVQSGLLLAWAMPVIAVLTVWQWMFDAQYGVVNHVLTAAGLDFEGHSWLINPWSFFMVATLIVVWMSIPFVAFTIYAGLTQVPGEILEAAQIDGASTRQRLWYVVMPSVKPILLVTGLLQVIWDLRVFTQIYVLQNAGGVTRDTNLLGTYVYRLGMGEGRFGVAATVAIFMLALTAILTFGYVRAMLREEDA